MSHPDRVASFDIGSNTVLMLIAERDPGGAWRRIDEHAEITRIAAGLDSTGTLAPEPVERTARALERFDAIATRHGVSRVLATGTAPFRRARNGAQVARALSLRLGSPIHVASGEEEAQLSLLASRASFGHLDPVWIVDIGGASTEVIWCHGARSDVLSIDVGSVRLAERTLPGDGPPDAHQRAALDAAIGTALARLDVPADRRGHPLIGIAGTVTTIAAIDLDMATWDADRAHGHQLQLDRIEAIDERLMAMSRQQRETVPGVDPRRADVIHAGARLLAAICRHLHAPAVTVSDRGVRWGRLFRELP